MEMEKKLKKRRIVLGVAIALLVAYLFAGDQVKAAYHTIRGVISPFTLGAIFAFILNVPMRAIERRLDFIKKARFKRFVSVVITVLIVLVILSMVSYLLVDQIVRELTKLSSQVDIPQLEAWVLKISKLEGANPLETVKTVIGYFTKNSNGAIGSVLSGAFSAIGSIAAGVLEALIALVFAFYCLFQKETLCRQGRKLLYAFFAEENADKVIRVVRLSSKTFADFLSGQCLEAFILGSLFAIFMAIFRMPYILLVSTLIAVTAFIPYVGAWTGAIIGGLLILIGGEPMKAVVYVIMSIVLQAIENNIIYPRVVGRSVGLSGMWVLVAIAVGGALKGIIGMIVMIPMAAVIQTLLREATGKRLGNKNIDPEKLTPQPPEMRQRFFGRKKAEKTKDSE